MKKFEDLTVDELWMLREEIVLNSIYFHDYENSFGYNRRDICYFMGGYLEFLEELMKDYGIAEEDYDTCLDEFDTKENLYRWFLCYDDLSWVRQESDPFCINN
jgi:hypothetical protein